MRIQSNRRNFLLAGVITSAVIWFASKEKFSEATGTLQTIKQMQNDLFPQANPDKYMLIIFAHSRIDEDEKTYLKDGATWLNEEALEIYEKSYISLNAKDRQRVLISFSSHEWGESYIHKILTYTMEEYLGDPIYGGNKNEAGWKFLAHVGGKPGPKKAYL